MKNNVKVIPVLMDTLRKQSIKLKECLGNIRIETEIANLQKTEIP